MKIKQVLMVPIKKVHPESKIPQYAKEGDAGLDLTAVTIETHKKFIQYNTGLAMSIPKGHVGLLFPRSSVSKKDLSLANAVGVIDSGYRGEISLRFKTTNGHYNDTYNKGDRVGQLIVMPYPEVMFTEVEELEDTERGGDGFGSSGN